MQTKQRQSSPETLLDSVLLATVDLYNTKAQKNTFRVQAKVKLSLCLTKHYTTKKYGRVHLYIHVLLTTALVGGEWSASRPCRFILRVDPRVIPKDYSTDNCQWSNP
jgi:hypothetical protein